MANTRRSRKPVTVNSSGLDLHAGEAQATALVTNTPQSTTAPQSANTLVCEDTARGAIADRALSRRESTKSNGALYTEIPTEDKVMLNEPRSGDNSNKENSTPLETGREGCHVTSQRVVEATFQDDNRSRVPSEKDVSSGSQRTAKASALPALRKGARNPCQEGQKGRRKPANVTATIAADVPKRAANASVTGKAKDNAEVPSIEGAGNKHGGTSIEDDAADLLVLAAAAVLAGFRASGTQVRAQTDESERSDNLGPTHETVSRSEAAPAGLVPLRRSGRERKLTFKAKEASDLAESKGKGKKVQKANGQKTTAARKRKHEEVDIEGDEVVAGPAQSKRGRMESETPEERSIQGVASDFRQPQPTTPAITTG